jgi:glycosyltransferase involved in cell wall biosynthesis
MRIGIDVTVWNNRRGYGRHARALFKSLIPMDINNQYTLVIDSPLIPKDFPEMANVLQVKAQTPTTVAAASDSRRSIADMWRMSRALSARDFDVVIFPTIYSFVPVFTRARKILFIHDIIPEIFPKLTLPNRSARLFWRAKSKIGRFQADAIVTVSDYSKQCICDYFKIDPSKVYTVGEAADPIFRMADERDSIPDLPVGENQKNRKVVYLGGYGPHKNVAALIDTFFRVTRKLEYSDVCLILVGEYRKEVFFSQAGEIQSRIDALGIADRVIFTGYLSEEELVPLLNSVTVLVLPSLMEGFGLPAVEAAACGCPVIATTASPLPSILGDAGLYFDPNEPEELDVQLMRVLDSPDLRRRMRNAGLAAVRALSWDGSAIQMKAIIDQVGYGKQTT